MTTGLEASQQHYVGPPFNEAKVHDAMRIGVVTCRPETSLRDVARMMASYKIHSVVVEDVESANPQGIVSAIDIATAASSDPARICARDVATTELVTVPANETLEQAARLMSKHGVTHLVALEPETGRPVGVISASGLAAVLAAPHA
jgi:CBS domain-containing protein